MNLCDHLVKLHLLQFRQSEIGSEMKCGALSKCFKPRKCSYSADANIQRLQWLLMKG